MSSQNSQATPVQPASAAPSIRASDADRDAAVGLLSQGFAEGRLTADEHAERINAAYAARTWQELRQLAADLPAADTLPEPAAVPTIFTGADRCLLCLLLILCPPAGIAWWLLARPRPGSGSGLDLARAGGRAVTTQPSWSGRQAASSCC